MNRTTKLAAIDIGSNAIRLMIAEVPGAAGKLRVLTRRRAAVRLGADVFKSGYLSRKLIANAVNVVREFEQLCRRYKVVKIRAVATSALREASNSQVFIESVARRTGIEVEVISGAEEARLINLAVSEAIPLGRNLALTIDMGGGSTEINLVHNRNVIVSETHPIGAVRLLELIKAESIEEQCSSRLVRGYAHGICTQLKRQIDGRKIEVCVGTGGSFEALGDLRTNLLKLDGSDTLSFSELKRILIGLNSLSLEQRVRKLGLRPDRADVIAPAAEVLLEIMSAAGVNKIRLPKVGLRNGVILDLRAQFHRRLNGERNRQCLSFAYEMSRLYNLDINHSDNVRCHAVYLFDRFKMAHKLDRRERLLLELAALLHDAGRFISVEDHHKHSMYIIRATQFIGLDLNERDIVGCVARYHRGELPDKTHEVYRQLSDSDQRTVRRLAAFLRIADAADQGLGRVKRISLRKINNRRCSIKLIGRGNLTLERISCRSRADLLTQEFKQSVIFSSSSSG